MSISSKRTRSSSSPTTYSFKKHRPSSDSIDEVIDLTDRSFSELANSVVEDTVFEEDLELNETALDANELPVRRLDAFSIYDRRSQELANAMEVLLPKTGRFVASGLVSVHYDEEDSDDEDEGDPDDSPFVETLEIEGFDIHHCYDVKEREFDDKIYIRTSRAWYILKEPTTAYRHLFTPLWVCQQLTHLVITASPKTTLSDFRQQLSPPLYDWQLKTTAFLHYLEGIALTFDISQRSQDLVGKILKTPGTNATLDIHADNITRNTVTTPRVARAILPHLNVQMTILGQSLEPEEDIEEMDPVPEHVLPELIELDSPIGHGKYASARIDGVEYTTGDIVSVTPGEDDDSERAESAKAFQQYCSNQYAKRAWFCQIEFFYENIGTNEIMAHCVWLEHGSRTMLQQVTHQQELFLLHECADIHASSFLRKCDLKRLHARDIEPTESKDKYSQSYFTRFMWDGEEYSFTAIPDHDEVTRLRAADSSSPCMICGLRDLEILRETVKPVEDDSTGFSYFGVNYHVGDFVYVRPQVGTERQLTIGQIKGIDFEPMDPAATGQVSCTIRYYDRYKTNEEGSLRYDEHRLCRTRYKNNISENDLDGLAYVRYIRESDSAAINAWITVGGSPDRFYTSMREVKTTDGDYRRESMDEDDFNDSQCQTCLQDHIAESEHYFLRESPLALLDLFAGAGGLSTGMAQTRFFEKRWAIEHSLCAVKTYKENHPDSTVIHQDVNDALRHFVASHEAGHATPAPVRLSDGTTLPAGHASLPRRGQVDIIVGGPPCQSFSGANRLKKVDDARSTLPYTMLGFVEVFEPSYVVIENVPGFLQHKTVTREGEEIKMSALKLTVRGLLCLNYQVSFKVLQAGDYGSGQDRHRVIILAARSGTLMPSFPPPTHAFLKPAQKRKMIVRKSDHLLPPTRPSGFVEKTTYAAHPPVTVRQTIGDLPAFDWTNPHQLVPETSRDRQNRKTREEKGILQLPVIRDPVGYVDGTCIEAPVTRTQAMLRGPADFVDHYHVTESFSDRVVELTTMVPLKAWANHRYIEPKHILPARMRQNNKETYFGRLDADSVFKTALTSPKPYTSKAHFLHPTQKRTLTLREFARSQGFPDEYRFLSTKATPSRRLQEYFKMVGNAVPLPLATALGRSIGAVLMQQHKSDRSQAYDEEL
ncbi:DNA (cytosine-5)-methyltransferase [Mycena indigotica]|uniref:Cytosine-specific methyltransferase n=1 Tax=Mycena indigotica TaxID=2126181 RepID=A0A8H6SG48_9AGAR|nr:DNA (cytosine-5)-methyltransferase [Mycena indigotica]KAF7298933.1 DNA (cytosine-5)-methyltransferase [Mycena indigotica]